MNAKQYLEQATLAFHQHDWNKAELHLRFGMLAAMVEQTTTLEGSDKRAFAESQKRHAELLQAMRNPLTVNYNIEPNNTDEIVSELLPSYVESQEERRGIGDRRNPKAINHTLHLRRDYLHQPTRRRVKGTRADRKEYHREEGDTGYRVADERKRQRRQENIGHKGCFRPCCERRKSDRRAPQPDLSRFSARYSQAFVEKLIAEKAAQLTRMSAQKQSAFNFGRSIAAANILMHLETIDTPKLAIAGCSKEATAVSSARIQCDTILREAAAQDETKGTGER